MSIKSPHEENKSAQRVGYLKLIRIKIRELSTDTIAQSVERRRYKQKTWVRILGSV